MSFYGEVEELGRLCEELIDCVERLHAEEHKLEDRVAQAKQHAQVGEGRGGEGGRYWTKVLCCVCCIVFVSMLCMCIMLVH